MTQSTISDTTGLLAGNYGITIRIWMQEDITAATNRSLRVERPGGSVVSWDDPDIVDDEYLEYTTVLNDQPFVGPYKIYPKFTLGDFTGSDAGAGNAYVTMVMGVPPRAVTA